MPAQKFELRLKIAGAFNHADSLLQLRSHWDMVDGKPSTYTPTTHQHPISDVTNLQTSLNAKLNLSGGTMTGPLTVPQILFGYPIQNFNPFSSYKIHDSIQTNMLAGKWKKLKVTWDGVENTNMARIITDQNYEQYSGDTPHGVDGDADHVLDIDFVTNGLYGADGITYAEGTVVFNFYSSPFPTAWSCRWKDRNGVWTPITLTKNGYAQLIGTISSSALYLTNIEITLSTGTGAPYVTSNIKWGLCEVEYYGNRMSLSQGAYVSAVGGYVSGDIDVGGALRVNGQPISMLSIYRGLATALDTLYTPGFYNVTSSTTGQPNASNFGWLHVEVHNNADYNGTNNWLRQTFQQTDGKKYYRYKVNAAAWTAWYQEYNSQYKPSLTDLGALVETNQKLLFGGSIQYIRLAYADLRTKLFAQHSSGSEVELLSDANVSSLIKVGESFSTGDILGRKSLGNGALEKISWSEWRAMMLGESSDTAYRGDRGKIAYDHSQSTHAPTDAQKNSDITKTEIEAKLTGQITSHTHESVPKIVETRASALTQIWTGTQSQYDAIGTKDSNTLYFIQA